MIIQSKDVLRFNELETLTSALGKTLRKLIAERDETEASLIAAISAGAKVEAICPFRLQVNTEDKRYQPAYKACANELAGEKAVTTWVLDNDPHATKQVIELVPKKASPQLSKPTSALIDGLRATTARAA
jgi:hypothetical protein